MLTPRLKLVKERLEKNYSALSQPERELLNELKFFDSDIKVSEALKEKAIPKIVAGPSDKCPCCGK